MAKPKNKLVSKKKSIVNASKKKVVKKSSAKSKPKKVSAIPKGYNNITPYLIIEGASSAIEFYKKAFGAKEKLRMERDGRIGHAELQIGDTKIMLADECPEMQALSPKNIGGSPVSIHLYIKNVDEVTERSVSLGSRLIRPAQDMFYGDRSSFIEDPYGHKWSLSTHIENISPAKIKKRAQEFFGKKKD